MATAIFVFILCFLVPAFLVSLLINRIFGGKKTQQRANFQPPMPASIPIQPTAPPPTPAGSPLQCNYCGHMTPAGQYECSSCGAPVSPGPVSSPAPNTLDQQLRALLASNQKIAAIKLYRDYNPNTGLAEAKDYIESL